MKCFTSNALFDDRDHNGAQRFDTAILAIGLAYALFRMGAFADGKATELAERRLRDGYVGPASHQIESTARAESSKGCLVQGSNMSDDDGEVMLFFAMMAIGNGPCRHGLRGDAVN